MQLETLNLKKFENSALKKEQMFNLNGGGTKTEGGSGCGAGTSASNPDVIYKYDFGYDAIRKNADGSTYITYHNRTNVSVISAAECATYQGL